MLPLFLFDSHGGDEAEVVVADAGTRLFDGVVGRARLEAIGMACLSTEVTDVVALAVRDGYRVATGLGEQVFEAARPEAMPGVSALRAEVRPS